MHGKDRQWPEPRPQFLEETIRRLSPAAPPRRRLVLATAFAVVGVSVFAALGGVGSAMSGVSGTLNAIGGGTAGGSNGQFAAAQSQYTFPAYVCASRTQDGRTRYKEIYSKSGKLP